MIISISLLQHRDGFSLWYQCFFSNFFVGTADGRYQAATILRSLQRGNWRRFTTWVGSRKAAPCPNCGLALQWAKWPDRVICGTGILCFAVVVFIDIYHAWNELEIANLYFLTVFLCIGRCHSLNDDVHWIRRQIL